MIFWYGQDIRNIYESPRALSRNNQAPDALNTLNIFLYLYFFLKFVGGDCLVSQGDNRGQCKTCGWTALTFE